MASACDSAYDPAAGLPSVSTDKPDYSFSETTVMVSGDGYPCGVELRVRFTRPDGVADDDFVTTDALGHFDYEYWISAGAGIYVVDASSADGAASASSSFAWSSVMVLSDKTDYQPGETVTIAGADWAPGEAVELYLQVDPKTHADQQFIATADAFGDFVNRDYVVQEEDLGVTFLLRALGLSSGLTAQTTFTDHTGLFFSTFGAANQNNVEILGEGWDDSDDNGANAVVVNTTPRSAANSRYARLRNGASITRTVDTSAHDTVHLKFYCRGDAAADSGDLLGVFVDLNGDGDFADANEGPHNYSVHTTSTTGNACPNAAWSDQKDIDLSALSSAVNNRANARIRFQGPASGGRLGLVDDVEVTGADMCGNGAVEAVVGEECDEGAANGTTSSCCTATCTFKPAATTCRTSAGVCDVAETCSGTSGVCPADAFAPATQECRGSEGTCDVAENCTGSDAACPADILQPSTHECRASAGACDVAESCTGTDVECPADVVQPTTHECRASAGACDVTENCDGSTVTCPADAFEPATTACRESEGVCDLEEKCTGSAAACPSDAKSTAECRSSDGVCDVAESCDGIANDCPVDAFKPATTTCRESEGACDLEDKCTGSAAACPADAKSTAECRGSDGVCDVAESCDGVGNECPVDAFQPSSVTCRPSEGACDPAESCTGAAAACPVDGKSTALCRVATGVCDVAESCDGVNDDCPLNGFQPSTVECRGSAGECDLAESCMGDGPSCPTDVKSTAECRPEAGECDVSESCDGVSDDCPADDLVAGGTECRGAAGDCDVAESCSGTDTQCPEDAKSTAECRATTGECDPAEDCDGVSDDCPADAHLPNGTSCTDPDTCQADACHAGECTAGAIPWSGVLQPINQDGSSIFKLGSTIPVKFRLTGECANVSLDAKIYLAKLSSGIAGDEVEATSTSAADTGNTFRWSEDQYIYNLATKTRTAGTWQIRIDLGDGVVRTVVISLRK
ncbi:MAG: PxKF domain-containing protein [Candidatus Binatia bacterium]